MSLSEHVHKHRSFLIVWERFLLCEDVRLVSAECVNEVPVHRDLYLFSVVSQIYCTVVDFDINVCCTCIYNLASAQAGVAQQIHFWLKTYILLRLYISVYVSAQ